MDQSTFFRVGVLVCCFLLGFAANIQSQCTGGANMGSLSPTAAWQTVPCVNAGQYWTFNATVGTTYTFSFCPPSPGSAPFTFDTYLTILTNAGVPVPGAFNDNGCFPIFSVVTWVATSTATFRILVSLPPPGCGSNAICAAMAYQAIAPVGPGATCGNPLVIPSLPYNASGLTTCGAINDYNNTHSCGSMYMNGEDYVFRYTSPGNECINISVTGTTQWVGLFVLDGCPNAGGNCIAARESGAGNPSLSSVSLTAPGNYFFIISTLPPPTCTPFNISVTRCPSGRNCADPRVITSLPYTGSNLTTCGFINDYSSTMGCTSPYMNGDDFVFSYTTSGPICLDIFLTNTLNWTGVFLLNNCPSTPGVTCLGSNTSVMGNPRLVGVNLPGAGTYYIVVSTSPMPQCTPFNILVDTCRPPVPCGLNPPPSDSCMQAVDITNYNPFCGRTDSIVYGSHSPGNLPAVFCGTIENNHWYSFVADSTTVTFWIQMGNCYFGNGIQAQVFSTSDCITFTAVSNCFNPMTQANGTIIATPLVVGNTYYLMVDGYARDDCEYTIFWDGGPMPVEFGSINALEVDNEVHIHWETFSESNNLGFFIERGTPADLGEPNGFRWENVGFVDGHGTTNGLNRYFFSEAKPKNGEAYYRIRQMDYDGYSSWSEILTVRNTPARRNELLEIYPNPAKDHINITMDFAAAGTADFRLYDLSGHTVFGEALGSFTIGKYARSLELNDLPGGIYFYDLGMGAVRHRGKLVIVR